MFPNFASPLLPLIDFHFHHPSLSYSLVYNPTSRGPYVYFLLQLLTKAVGSGAYTKDEWFRGMAFHSWQMSCFQKGAAFPTTSFTLAIGKDRSAEGERALAGRIRQPPMGIAAAARGTPG